MTVENSTDLAESLRDVSEFTAVNRKLLSHTRKLGVMDTKRVWRIW